MTRLLAPAAARLWSMRTADFTLTQPMPAYTWWSNRGQARAKKRGVAH